MGYFDDYLNKPEPQPEQQPAQNADDTDYGLAALKSECQTVADAPEGERNHTLNRAWFQMGKLVGSGRLTRQTAKMQLWQAAQQSGLPPHEIQSVLRDGGTSGATAGAKHPRQPATDLDSGDSGSYTEVAAHQIDPNQLNTVNSETARQLALTPAAQIRPRRTKWVWDQRIAVGTLGLLAGKEGLGKSTIGYWIASQITKGMLPGEHQGQPKGVLVAATEDSWEHTIVPRLIAAGADLNRVFRVEIITEEGVHGQITLPKDLERLRRSIDQTDAGLLLLDPLMSRLSSGIDSHKDGEVRLALEPLVSVADQHNISVLGLIHHNKGGSGDPLDKIMASKAFTAVARAVHTVVPDPEDEDEIRRMFGTPKNNLGSDDLPSLTFTVGSYPVETEDDGTAWTSRIEWGEESDMSISQAMADDQGLDEKSATSEAAGWLHDYLEMNGGSAPSNDVKSAAKAAGHSERTIKRAKSKIRIVAKSHGYPRATDWYLPEAA